ncbi:hypothetical protein BpHYR1_023449 [Brachionus plicatilis]|uniref:Uncharacterized protein n=1 Tax=Brachionus plicatilis TaxID=10195 RepID=A0A3M7Q6D2_BRAPC|nr:hypothetical protein BpHYR1_023449 [Brachionus plicatilis]
MTGKFLPQIVATFFYLWLLLFEVIRVIAVAGLAFREFEKSLIVEKCNWIFYKKKLFNTFNCTFKYTLTD